MLGSAVSARSAILSACLGVFGASQSWPAKRGRPHNRRTRLVPGNDIIFWPRRMHRICDSQLFQNGYRRRRGRCSGALFSAFQGSAATPLACERPHRPLFITGFIGAMVGVELFAVCLFGQVMSPIGLILPWAYAAAIAGGVLIFPGDQTVVCLVVLMLVHASIVLMHIATLKHASARHCVRAGVCASLLVCMAYPVNRAVVSISTVATCCTVFFLRSLCGKPCPYLFHFASDDTSCALLTPYLQCFCSQPRTVPLPTAAHGTYPA